MLFSGFAISVFSSWVVPCSVVSIYSYKQVTEIKCGIHQHWMQAWWTDFYEYTFIDRKFCGILQYGNQCFSDTVLIIPVKAVRHQWFQHRQHNSEKLVLTLHLFICIQDLRNHKISVCFHCMQFSYRYCTSVWSCNHAPTLHFRMQSGL